MSFHLRGSNLLVDLLAQRKMRTDESRQKSGTSWAAQQKLFLTISSRTFQKRDFNCRAGRKLAPAGTSLSNDDRP